MIKKILTLLTIYLFTSINIQCACANEQKSFIKYHKFQTISIDNYLNSRKDENDWSKLKLNKNGDVIYKRKVIIDYSGQPINNSSESLLSIKIYIVAAGIKAKKGCDETNYIENGIYGLGCYFDNPNH